MVFGLIFRRVLDFNHKIAGPFFRVLGNFHLRISQSLHPLEGLRHRIFPSPQNLKLSSFMPQTSKAIFIGPSTHIKGNVILSEDTAIMYNSFIECLPNTGTEQILIGPKSIIEDLVTLKAQNGNSTVIGNSCYVGGNSSILNSTIEDDVYIGPGCTVFNSTIRKGAYLAPGTVVRDSEIKGNTVFCKNPHEELRQVSFQEHEYLSQRIDESIELAKIYATRHLKNSNTMLVEDGYASEFYDDEHEESHERQVDMYNRHLEDLNLPRTIDDLQHGEYRDWVLEEMENRRLFGYKNSEFEPSKHDSRPKDMFGAFQPDVEKHLELHERSENRKGKLVEPDVNFDKEEYDYKEEIKKRNDESNKF